MKKALLVLIPVFVLYAACVSPTIFVGDSPELITAAKTLGAAHPPGYASFTVITKAFTEALPFGNFAYRANLANAVYLFISLLFLSALLKPAALFYFALAPAVFSAALACEVFTLNLLFASAVCFLLAANSRRRTLAAAFVFGVGLANQQTLVLITPAVLFLLARRKMLSLKSVSQMTLVSLLGFSVTLLLIIRAWHGASFVWGDPGSWAGLWRHLLRKDYGTFALHGGQYSVSLFSLGGWAALGLAFIGPLFLFAPAAYLAIIKRAGDFAHFAFIGFFFTGPFFYLISGLTSADFSFVKAVMERFFILPAVFAVILFEEVVRRTELGRVFTGIALLVAALFAFEVPAESLRNFYSLSDLADSVLRSVPQNGRLIIMKGAVGDDLIFALAYKKWAVKENVPGIYSYYGSVFPTVYGRGSKKMTPAQRMRAESRFYSSGRANTFFAFSPEQIPVPGCSFDGLVWDSRGAGPAAREEFWRLSRMNNYRVRSLEILSYYFRLLDKPAASAAADCEYRGADIDWLLTNLGPVWASLDNTERAKEVYLKSLSINPYLPETNNNLGVLYFNEGKYAAAAKYFRLSVSYEKDSVRFYNLGLALNKTGRTVAARWAFENSLSMNPYNYKTVNELGLIELNSGRPARAVKIFEKGLEINPSDENLKFNLALAEKKLKRKK